jgi:hypothetical protein
MTAYKSTQMTAPRYPVSGPGIGGRSIKVERGEFALTAALASGDTIDMFKLHPRFRVCGGFVKSTDLDTNGSPAIVLALGDSGDDDRYFTGLTIGQAGGVSTTLASTGVDYYNNTSTFVTVQAKVTTGPGTGATTGTIVAELWGYIEEPA